MKRFSEKLVPVFTCLLVCLIVAQGTVQSNQCTGKDTDQCQCTYRDNKPAITCYVNNSGDHYLSMDSDILTNVSALTIRGCGGLSRIRNLIGTFPSLEYLTLCDCQEPNTIRPDEFVKFSNTKHLKIHNYGINQTDNGAFRSLQHLISLDLSRNVHLTYEKLGYGLTDFHSPDLEVFNISSIHNAERLDPASLGSAILGKIGSTKLKILDISWTRVVSVKAPLTLFPQLQYLKLSGTFILGTPDCLTTIIALEYLDTIEFDLWPSLPRGIETTLPRLNYLQKRSDGNLVHICEEQQKMSEKNCFIVPKTISTLIMRYCDSESLFFDFRTDFCIEANVLINLILSQITIFGTMGTLSGLHRLEYIDVSYPDMTGPGYAALKGTFSMDMPSIKYILIPGTRLNLLPSNALEQMFSKNPELRVLDISANELGVLPKRMLEHNFKLEILNLSNNRLKEFPGLMNFNLSHIRVLDLSNNLLRSIDTELLLHLDEIGHAVEINLTRNHLVCGCWMNNLDFLQNISLLFECIDGTKIKTFSGTGQLFKNVSSYPCHDDAYSDETWLVPTLGVSVVVACMVIVGVVIMCYIRRTRKQTKDVFISLEPLNNQNQNRNAMFLAFLAYNHEDASFARKIVYEPLEKKLKRNIAAGIVEHDAESLMICYDKHFLPHESIDELIDRAINNSRVTITLVSEAFMNSIWCHFEVNSSYEAGIPIIPIYLPSCQPGNLRGVIKQLYETKTRLTWPDTSNMSAREAKEAEHDVIERLCQTIMRYISTDTE